MTDAPVIEVCGLTRRFGPLVAVDHVDLSIRRGEIFGCLGPNGSGKSTLMRVLLGLLEPSAGTVKALGFAVPTDAERLRPLVGYMTQRFSLYEDLSVRENLDFVAAVFGLPGRERRARVAAALADAGLEVYAAARAATLSGGWKQRLALAAATVHRPQLLVLDEPTAGVDPQNRRIFWEKLFQLAAGGTTIFVSTHYMDEAVRCHRLALLRDGRRVALGRPGELTIPLAARVLDVDVADPELAVVVLRNASLVASTTRLGDTVHILLTPDAPPAPEAAGAVVRLLREARIAGARAVPGRPTLEDVFVAILLGERLGSDQGSA
jgi:ABC-2 type transport system ATP-binding protein